MIKVKIRKGKVDLNGYSLGNGNNTNSIKDEEIYINLSHITGA